MPEDTSKSASGSSEYDLEAVALALTEWDGADRSRLAQSELESEMASVKEVIKLIERARRTGITDTRHLTGDQPTVANLAYDSDPGEISGLGSSLDQLRRIGRFEIVEQLGQGGYGLVFLACDTELDRRVALKVPRPEAIMTAELRARFLREGKTAGLLSHPNIVPVFEVGHAGAVCYLVSRYVEGVTLSAWMTKHNTTCEAKVAAAIVAMLADAVQHAHSKGVIHRDLKPANVILESISGDETTLDAAALATAVRIMDFGLAKMSTDNGLTGTGAIIGTPSYMSPEQAAGSADAADATTDVYSLGAILYELLTGRPPFTGSSILETLQQVQRNEPLAPRRIEPDIPRDLEAICLKSLDKQPAARYSTAADLHADLDRYLHGRPVVARPVGLGRRLKKWCQRNPAIAALSVVMLVSAMGGLIGLTSLWLRSEHHREVAEQRGQHLAQQVTAKQAALDLAHTKSRQLTDSVRELFSVVAAHREITTPEAAPLRQRVIEHAESVYDSVIAESADDETMKLEHAKSIFGVGLLCHELGEPRRAKEKIIEAIRIAESLDLKAASTEHLDPFQTLGSWWAQLGYIHTSLGEFPDADKAFMRGLECLQANISSEDADAIRSPANRATEATCARAVALKALNAIQAKKVDQALRYSEQSERQWRALSAAYPADELGIPNRFLMAHSLLILGQVYEVQGNLQKSEALLSEAIDIYKQLQQYVSSEHVGDRAIIARTHHYWGIAVARQDRLEEARVAYSQAILMLKELVSDSPYFATAQEYLTGAQYSLAFTEYLSGDFERAERLLLENVKAHRTMAERFPDRAYISWDRAGDNYGVLSVIQRDRPDADVEQQVIYLRQAATAYEQSLAQRAEWREPIAGWARAKTMLGQLMIDQNDLPAAETHLIEATGRLEQVIAEDGSWLEARACLVGALHVCSQLHAARQQWSAAIETCRRAIDASHDSPSGQLFLDLAKYLAFDSQLDASKRELLHFAKQPATQDEEIAAAATAAADIADRIQGDPREAEFRDLAAQLEGRDE